MVSQGKKKRKRFMGLPCQISGLTGQLEILHLKKMPDHVQPYANFMAFRLHYYQRIPIPRELNFCNPHQFACQLRKIKILITRQGLEA